MKLVKNWHRLSAEHHVIGGQIYGIKDTPSKDDPGFPSRAELMHLSKRLTILEICKRFNATPKQVEQWMKFHKINIEK